MDLNNLSIIRQSFANTVFTHKVQEVAAENAGKMATRVKCGNLFIVALALTMLLLQVGNPTKIIFSYLGSGIAAAELIFLIVQLTFDYERVAISHKNSALKYMQLRDKYRSLIADVMNDQLSEETLVARRNSLQAEYQVISDLAPQTTSNDYVEAQNRLNTNGNSGEEHYTWADSEIDQFLPGNLRLG